MREQVSEQFESNRESMKNPIANSSTLERRLVDTYTEKIPYL